MATSAASKKGQGLSPRMKKKLLGRLHSARTALAIERNKKHSMEMELEAARMNLPKAPSSKVTFRGKPKEKMEMTQFERLEARLAKMTMKPTKKEEDKFLSVCEKNGVRLREIILEQDALQKQLDTLVKNMATSCMNKKTKKKRTVKNNDDDDSGADEEGPSAAREKRANKRQRTGATTV